MLRAKGLSVISRLTLALVVAPVALVAQSTTTAALMGVVKDPSGKPLAAATVRVTSPALMGERVAKTAENGSYRFPLLPPGPYRITVEAAGLNTLVGKEVLELGKTSTVNWKFQAAASTTVEVVATAAAAETASTSFNQNYSPEKLATLPAERSLTAIMDMTPGVNGGHAWGGAAGENAYMMDGMNVGDPAGGTQWIFPNMDWFSEVQVGGMGAGAEFGGFTGGYINGLVKRGGNTIEGSLNAYYGSSKWEAKPSWASSGDLAPTKDWDVALNVGGPILKDKIWYFASFERVEDQSTPINAVSSIGTSQVKGLAKFTWQVNDATTLELMGEYDYLKRENRGLDYSTLPIATLKEIAPNRSFNATWTQVLGPDKVLTVKTFGYGGRYDLNTYNGQAMPLDTGDVYNGFEYYNNAQTEQKNYRDRTNLSATFDWFLPSLIVPSDSHSIKIGVEGETATNEELQRYPGGANLNAYVDEGQVYSDFIITGGGWAGKQRTRRFASFISDEWKINDRVTIRPGLRFEQFKARFYGEDSYRWNKSTFAPRFGLKVALTQDQQTILNAHLGRYYAGYSTYFIDRSVRWAIPVKNYYTWATDSDGVGTVLNPNDPSTWPAVDLSSANLYKTVDNYSPVDSNAKQPHTDEVTLSVTRKFMSIWSASTSWVYRDFKDALVRHDKALDGVDLSGLLETFVNPETGKAAYDFDTTSYSDHQYTVGNDKRAKRRYWAITASAERELKDHWSLMVSYTRAKLYGNVQKSDGYVDVFANPNNTINSYGLLPGYNDNEIKARATYEFPWAMRVSVNYTYLSGEHWTPTWRTYAMPAERYYVNAEPLGSRSYPGRSLVDIRVSQMVDLSKGVKMEGFVDLFNALNQGNVTSWNTRVNSAWDGESVYSDYQAPTDGDRGRRARLGLRVTF
ncbi:MAG: OmpA-like protein [Holophagaceae bacterium]|nr:OmpA-like protein [Holophagaceae bacterium]